MIFHKPNITEQDMIAIDEQNKKIKEQLIQDMYPGKEVTQEMRKIKSTIVLEDFGLDNVFGSRREIIRCYVSENTFGEKALIVIKTGDNFDSDGLSSITIKEAAVLLPFANRKFLNSDCFGMYTRNLDTGKMGRYIWTQGFLAEKYDNLYEGKFGLLIATIDGKIGRLGEKRKIPIKYDELVEIGGPSCINLPDGGVRVTSIPEDSVVLVKLDGKWGAYCYIWDYHEQYISESERTIRRRYLKKRFIPPLFDKIEIHTIDEEEAKIILKVWLNNKMGLLEVFSREFICPVVFDKITKWVETNEGESIVYGYIDGVLYKYSDDVFTKEEVVNIEYSEPYIRVREKIKKK